MTAGGSGDVATITQMAFVAGDRPVRPRTADEVMRWIVRLTGWLHPSVRRFVVRSQFPLVVRDRTSLPEPDIAVVEPGDDLIAHPDSALLVIEVLPPDLAEPFRGL